jgi:hypothetical protein
MRKVSLLSAVLLVLGLFALQGQEMMAMADEGSGLPFEVTGEATATLGYNLDTNAWGFTNEFDSSLTLSLVAEQSTGTSGDGWRGDIQLEDFQLVLKTGLEVDDDDVILVLDDTATAIALPIIIVPPSITAKITNGSIYVLVYENDGIDISAVSIVEDDEDDDYLIQGDDDGLDLAPDLTNSGGLSFGYESDMFSVALHVASETDWTGADDDGMSVGVDGSVTAGPITITADVIKALNQDANDLAAGLGLTLDLAMGEGMSLVVNGGVDLHMSDVVDPMIMEYGGDVTLNLSDTTSLKVAAIYSPDTAADGDLEVSLAEDGGMVDGLSVDVLFGMYNFINGAGDYLLSADLGYDVALDGATLTPAIGIDYTSTGITAVEVSATLSGAIPHTDFVLTWATDDINVSNGVLTVETTITY